MTSSAPESRHLHAGTGAPAPATRAPIPAVPRLAYSPGEAAQALGCSRSHFDAEILPELRVVRRGRRVIVPFRELERWLDRNAARPLEGGF
jgi:hypothetical protein